MNPKKNRIRTEQSFINLELYAVTFNTGKVSCLLRKELMRTLQLCIFILLSCTYCSEGQLEI